MDPEPSPSQPRRGSWPEPLLDPLAFAAVLAAALMHAGWNAVVRVGLDRFSSILDRKSVV